MCNLDPPPFGGTDFKSTRKDDPIGPASNTVKPRLYMPFNLQILTYEIKI